MIARKLGSRVLVPTLEGIRKGVIVSTQWSSDTGLKFKVAVIVPTWAVDFQSPVAEYLGELPSYIWFDSKYVVAIDSSIQDDLAKEYERLLKELADTINVAPAVGEDLEKIGKDFGVYRLSNEHDDDFRKRIKDEFYNSVDNIKKDSETYFTPIEKECQHSWKLYQGIMDSYDYCEKCDEKRK